MRHLVVAIVLGLCLFQFESFAFAKDSMEARIEAATAYEKAVPVDDMINSMLDEMKKNPQIALTADDVEIIRSSYDVDELRSRLISGMAKHFTVGELNALNDFYSKPEGRSVMRKMPAYMNDFMPYIQEQMIKGVKLAMQKRAAQKEQQQQ